MSLIFEHFNHWVVVILMMIGLYIVITANNLVKKVVGLNIFQSAVFLMYITMGKVVGGTAPILAEGVTHYSNTLHPALILPAIVVGLATTAVGLSSVPTIKSAHGTCD